MGYLTPLHRDNLPGVLSGLNSQNTVETCQNFNKIGFWPHPGCPRSKWNGVQVYLIPIALYTVRHPPPQDNLPEVICGLNLQNPAVETSIFSRVMYLIIPRPSNSQFGQMKTLRAWLIVTKCSCAVLGHHLCPFFCCCKNTARKCQKMTPI